MSPNVTRCHSESLLNVYAYLASASLLNLDSVCVYFPSAPSPWPMPRQPMPLPISALLLTVERHVKPGWRNARALTYVFIVCRCSTAFNKHSIQQSHVAETLIGPKLKLSRTLVKRKPACPTTSICLRLVPLSFSSALASSPGVVSWHL